MYFFIIIISRLKKWAAAHSCKGCCPPSSSLRTPWEPVGWSIAARGVACGPHEGLGEADPIPPVVWGAMNSGRGGGAGMVDGSLAPRHCHTKPRLRMSFLITDWNRFHDLHIFFKCFFTHMLSHTQIYTYICINFALALKCHEKFYLLHGGPSHLFDVCNLGYASAVLLL